MDTFNLPKQPVAGDYILTCHGGTLHCIGADTCMYLLETEHLITMRLYVQD